MITSSVRIRLSDEERNKLDTIARNLQISRSALIRQYIHAGVSNKESAKVIRWDNDTIKAICNLNMLIAKIGINVNQIARACNRGNYQGSLIHEINAMQQVLGSIRKVVNQCL